MISPFKAALGIDYRIFEDKLETAIHIRFGPPAKTPKEIKALIKKADRPRAFSEPTQLAGFGHAESLVLFGAPPPRYHLTIEPWSTAEAQRRYVERFDKL